MGIKETFTKAKNSASHFFIKEKLTKAKFIVFDEGGRKSSPIQVQFNPSEYTISRGVDLAGKPGLGKDSDGKEISAVNGKAATLRVSFYFDTYTDFGKVGIKDIINVFKGDVPGGAKNKAKNLLTLQLFPNVHKDPRLVCDMLMSLIKYEPKLHQPATVEFQWGSLDFIGKVLSSSVQYTMFDPTGVPVRAKVDMTIVGEEEGLAVQIMQFPPESPDRTKERTLLVGDQLWMMAQQEYSDPAMWKVIADSNQILNPRKIEKTVNLRVPSIR